MLQKIKNVVVPIFLAISLLTGAAGLAGVGSTTTHASVQSQIQSGVNGAGGSGQSDLNGFIVNIVNILLFIIGAVAVIFIIIGGITYTTSGGDQSKITSAKNTILYAVVGVVVAGLAYAIVNFVVDNLF